MIPLIKPDIAFDAVADDLRAIIDSGQLTSGPYVAAFETSIRDLVGAKYAVTTTSATTAMHMTLAAMGVGPGDEVLVSDFTFPATGNVIVQTGATPVLVDCVAERFDIDPADLAAKVTDRSCAILVVHPFGQPADMAAINRIADKHGLRVIEDAACALGTTLADGRAAGAASFAGCFSFHPRKVLTTGEGGMIVTSDDDLAARLAVLRSHGGERGRVGLNFVENGFNYRMSEIQACLGLEQVRRFDSILGERRRIAMIYMDRLPAVDGVKVPLSSDLGCCSIQSFVALLDNAIDRDLVSERMREAGIETTLGTYAMHSHPAFSRFGYEPGTLPHAYRAQRQSLTLPAFKGMTPADVDRVLSTLAVAIETA